MVFREIIYFPSLPPHMLDWTWHKFWIRSRLSMMLAPKAKSGTTTKNHLVAKASFTAASFVWLTGSFMNSQTSDLKIPSNRKASWPPTNDSLRNRISCVYMGVHENSQARDKARHHHCVSIRIQGRRNRVGPAFASTG